ncbi:hypothetical protein Mjas_02290 [Methanothermococcus sp. Ax23]|uniref:hypothetical protein n=1 Tax=Methanothermococcus sp. Ax23 TaxID=3156486 RepID=UPI003B9EBFD3
MTNKKKKFGELVPHITIRKINNDLLNVYYIKKIDESQRKKVVNRINDIIYTLNTIKKLQEINKIRKKRNIKAIICVSIFVILYEILWIFMINNPIINFINAIFAVAIGLIGVIFLAYGLYLLLYHPLIYVED